MSNCKRMLCFLLVLSIMMSLLGMLTVGAQDSGVSNVRYLKNTDMVFEDGVTSNNYQINGKNKLRYRYLVSKEKLGITRTVAENIVEATENTPYSGHVISGELTARDTKMDETADGEGLKNGIKATYIKFEGLEIPYIQFRNGDDNVGLEFSPADIIAHATEWKVWDSKTGTEVSKDISELTADNLSVDDNALYRIQVTHTKNENYQSMVACNVAPFTADTKFLSMQKDNLYIGAADGSKWSEKNEGNWSVWYNFKETGVNKDIAGPYQVVVPNFSGEYKVYGLKYGHTTSSKEAKVTINSTPFKLSDLGGTAISGWNIYWSNATNEEDETFTFTAGEPVIIMDTTVNPGKSEQGAVLALAFVPVNQSESVILNDSNRIIENLMMPNNVGNLASIDFVNQKVSSYEITVKDSMGTTSTEKEFTVKPLYRRSRFAGTESYDYNENSIVGHPTKYATVNDFVAQYLIEEQGKTWDEIKDESATDTYQVYVNGIREYRPNQKFIKPGDTVEIKKEAVTVHNFAPINLSGALNAIYRQTNPLRARIMIKSSFVKSYLYNNEGSAEEAPFKDAKLAGYMTWKKDDQYKGNRVYFRSEAPTSISVEGGWTNPKGAVLPEYTTKYGDDSTMPILSLEGKDVHDPEKLFVNGTSAPSTYSTDDLYWVNSTTTNDVRYEEIDDEYVIRTDGFAMIFVIFKKANGTLKSVEVDLTPGTAYVFKPEKGDTVYVWENTVYGTTLNPLFEPFK